jgi:hypothetical protein
VVRTLSGGSCKRSERKLGGRRMIGCCSRDGIIFHKGERIFQLAKGTYYSPAITPTLWSGEAVIGEWHLSCLPNIPLHPQVQPYHCCFGSVGCVLDSPEIDHGDALVYGVIGHRPSVGYMRPEWRGYSLQLVAHYGCWYSRKLGWDTGQSAYSRLCEALRAEGGIRPPEPFSLF